MFTKKSTLLFSLLGVPLGITLLLAQHYIQFSFFESHPIFIIFFSIAILISLPFTLMMINLYLRAYFLSEQQHSSEPSPDTNNSTQYIKRIFQSLYSPGNPKIQRYAKIMIWGFNISPLWATLFLILCIYPFNPTPLLFSITLTALYIFSYIRFNKLSQQQAPTDKIHQTSGA
ncbi:hypothetical protein JD969_02445 [Planctomycetota bacterium]|nr:hypothetical protein JD969_02445 [Planctomycetota bacterium]